jgi:23S rRNA pseudouridine2605 synthase
VKPVRLHKHLAALGIGSRRRCEQLITRNRIRVNGGPARLGMSVVPGQDLVEVDGRTVSTVPDRIVIAFNKPAGVLSTCRRGRERGTPVTELVDVGCRLFPAGRLDRDTEGLLILTNDGELALRLTHPRYAKEKEYEADLAAPVPGIEQRLVRGVQLKDGPARALKARNTQPTRIRLVLTEGRKRQVRRMLEALGAEVTRLRRIRIGGLRLGSLAPGAWERLSDKDINRLLGPPPA